MRLAVEGNNRKYTMKKYMPMYVLRCAAVAGAFLVLGSAYAEACFCICNTVDRRTHAQKNVADANECYGFCVWASYQEGEKLDAIGECTGVWYPQTALRRSVRHPEH
jgi:hypothetical protein